MSTPIYVIGMGADGPAGLRPEQRVGVLMERSVDLVVAVLGIVKAGGAYLPLDVRAPAERMRLWWCL